MPGDAALRSAQRDQGNSFSEARMTITHVVLVISVAFNAVSCAVIRWQSDEIRKLREGNKDTP